VIVGSIYYLDIEDECSIVLVFSSGRELTGPRNVINQIESEDTKVLSCIFMPINAAFEEISSMPCLL
jgi:hypothetical protein